MGLLAQALAGKGERQDHSKVLGLDDLGCWGWEMKTFCSQLQLPCSEMGTALLTLLVKHLVGQLVPGVNQHCDCRDNSSPKSAGTL